MDEETRYRQIQERVEALKGFYVHLTVYAIVNLGLFLINLVTDGGNWWFFWPLLGWGVALAIHGAVIFGAEAPWGKRWEERKIQQLMEHENRQAKA